MALDPITVGTERVAEQTFSLVYGGLAVDSGSMEIGDLAPALIALAALFREAHSLINPNQPPVSLRVSATTRGSFEVQLVAAINDAVSLFASTGPTALANLVSIVIGGGGTVGGGLFWLIRTLRRRRFHVQRSADADPQPTAPDIVITFEDGTTLAVSAELLMLYDSVEIRRAASKVVEPLERDGIDYLEFRRDSQATATVAKADVAEFDIPSVTTTALPEHESDMLVRIVAPNFETNNWRVTDGGASYFVAIEDAAFLERVQGGQEAFRAGDTLVCEMAVRQSIKSTGELATQRVITRVKDHIPVARRTQMPLFESAEPDE